MCGKEDLLCSICFMNINYFIVPFYINSNKCF